MIVRSLLLGLVLAGASGCATPLAAEDRRAPSASAAAISGAKAASERGALLYAYDRAAWLGSDAFQADAIRLGDVQPLGYLVMPGKENALDFVVYGAVGGRGPLQIGRYPVVGETVVGGNLGIAPLGETALRMIAARNAAAMALSAQGLRGCGDGTLNTVVLPPASDGSVAVYLLTPVAAQNGYPLAGHFRFDIAPDGAVAGWRKFGSECGNVVWDSTDEDLATRVHYIAAPAAAAHPDEVHSFIGHHFPIVLGVVTGALVWPVLGGAIADPVAAEPGVLVSAEE